MFIRKRTYKTKYGISESYQAIETYRENGKVKQKILANLGRFPTPERALEDAKLYLRKSEECLQILNDPSCMDRQKKYRIALWSKVYPKMKKWVDQLEDVVSKTSDMPHKYDTTEKVENEHT